MHHDSARYAGYRFEFGRVNVMLGANGAGKSKLLNEIKARFHNQGQCSVIYIEGGRTIKIMDVLKFDVKNFSQYDVYDTALTHYENKRSQSLADRVFDALVVLDKREAQIKAEHSDLVDKWIESGAQGECPKRLQPPLEHLFELFNEIFPLIQLEYDSSKRRLTVTKGEEKYGPSALSDGEKQVFSILADLLELSEKHKIIVADEPELNLHPELAERLWTLLENEFSDKTFIYATHSINFALRENVNKVWVLSSDAQNITEFSGLDDLPRKETAELLGSLPGILSSNRVVVTEGHEKSFDALFYRWVIGDNRVEILPAGGCSDVVSIVNKHGIWSKITSRIALAGVIDSDFRDDTYLGTLASQGVLALPLHEAEAYLCIPEIVEAVGSRIGSSETPITANEVREVVFDTLASNKLFIAAKRVFAASHMHLGVSLERSLLASAADKVDLVRQVKEAAAREVEKASSQLSSEAVEQKMDAEISAIEAVIACQDVQRALKLLPAKELANRLAPRAGCRTAADLMRSLRHNFRPGDFELTSELSQRLASSLGVESAD